MQSASSCNVLLAAILASVASAQSAPIQADPKPPALHFEAVVFDEGRGRLVLFGGTAFGATGPDTASPYRGQTWEWDGTRWHITVDASGGPGDRGGAAMAFDPHRRRTIMFGGSPGTPNASVALCDTWSYDGERWLRLGANTCPTGRAVMSSLVYDRRRQQMLLIEGVPMPAARDTITRPVRIFRWTDSLWTPVDTMTGPVAARLSRPAYDERRSTLVMPVLGGPDDGVWEWDGTWKRVAGAGPAARSGQAVAYDPRLREIVIAGGRSRTAPFRDFDDAWSWDGTRWTQLPGPGPSARTLGTLLADTRQNRLLYFGGTSTTAPLQELWSLSDRGWTPLQR